MPAVRNTRTQHPARSPQVEQMLKARGLDFEFEANLAIADIREAEGMQVRVPEHRAQNEQVTKYATAMSHGAVFPAIVVNESYEKIDGNTRLAAKRKNKTETIAAYIVYGITPVEGRSLSVELNQSNGLAMTDPEIRNFIVGAVREGQSLEVRTLARITGARELKIARWIAEARFEDRAQAEEIEIGSLPASTRAALNSIRLDSVFTDLTKLAVDAKLPAAEVKRLVSNVNGAPSERESLDIVTAERQARADEIRAIASGFSTARRSRGSAQHIGGLLQFDVADLLDVAADKQYDTYARMKDLRDRLDLAINRASQEWNLTPPPAGEAAVEAPAMAGAAA